MAWLATLKSIIDGVVVVVVVAVAGTVIVLVFCTIDFTVPFEQSPLDVSCR